MTNQQNLIDYSAIASLPEIWDIVSSKFPDITALHDPHSHPETIITYRELTEKIKLVATGLQVLGVKPESKVALIADNSPRWLIADQGIMMAGAVNVVRSSQADRDELLYIIKDSDSTCLVIEDSKTLAKLLPQLNDLPIELIILLSDETPELELKIKRLTFTELMETANEHQLQAVSQTKDNLATLIYTSGTTGQPKGVMLSHGNLLHQVTNLGTIIQPQPSDRTLSILPSWHSYERAAEYFLFSQGCTLIYTNIRYFKKDIKHYKPHHMVGVPRLWESIYDGIQKEFKSQPENKQKLINFFLDISERYTISKRIGEGLSIDHLHVGAIERLKAKIQAYSLYPLHALADKLIYQQVRQAVGGNIKTLISGGGSLARHLDDFFEIVNIPLLVGYGLTETSPVTNARTLEHNMKGTSGKPIPHTEIKIVDPHTRETLPQGERGLVLIRGPQIMQGYYGRPEATAKAIDDQGWFDSGDLGCVTSMNDLILTGRAKDTIVLTNGENIEPQPIEDACVRSPYIDQIMLVGQDQRSLGALIVPNLEALEQWSQQQNLNLQFPSAMVSTEEINQSDLNKKAVQDLFRQELNREVKNRPGYRIDDRIGPFQLILTPFSQENGMLTQTLKIKRPVVREHYQGIIDKMFDKL